MRLNRQLVCAFLLIGSVCTGVATHGHSQTTDEQDRALEQSLRKITQIYEVVNPHMADPPAADLALNDGAIRGALARLDPFSTF